MARQHLHPASFFKTNSEGHCGSNSNSSDNRKLEHKCLHTHTLSLPLFLGMTINAGRPVWSSRVQVFLKGTKASCKCLEIAEYQVIFNTVGVIPTVFLFQMLVARKKFLTVRFACASETSRSRALPQPIC